MVMAKTAIKRSIKDNTSIAAALESVNAYSVEFIDNGVAFNPVKAVIKDKDLLELDTGGMGIKLARMNSKDMIYSREKERNSLTLLFDV